jgi:NADH-quinone oxidoreductase subunit M
MSCLASLGLIAATVYSLRIVQKVFLGNKNTDWKMNDLTLREKVVSASLVIAILWLGLFPKPVLETAKPALLKTLKNQKEITLENKPNNTYNAHLTLSTQPFSTTKYTKKAQSTQSSNLISLRSLCTPL